jgi:hypothetical protein
MSTSRISEGHHAHRAVAAAFWGLAGIITLIAFGDVVALLALALAIGTIAVWMYREVKHRLDNGDARMAPVTQLRPGLTGQRCVQQASTHVSWHGPRAA